MYLLYLDKNTETVFIYAVYFSMSSYIKKDIVTWDHQNHIVVESCLIFLLFLIIKLSFF